MKLAITGANGFLAYHLRCHLLKFADYQLTLISTADFQNQSLLSEKIKDVDAVVHMAGVNRGSDDEVFNGNIQAGEKLIKALEANTKKPTLIFTSSTHIYKDSAYGRAKKQCGEMFSVWAKQTGSIYTELILPHVFGEGGKPYYNSTVATFCHQVVKNETPEIKVDIELNLVHAGDVALKIIEILQRPANKVKSELIAMNGEKIFVSAVLEKIKALHHRYQDRVIPQFKTAFDLNLFNTIRSYMFPQEYPVKLVLKTDNRGSLFEAVKTDHGGQAFLSTTKPGITRGQHYHYQKIERFCVIQGEATIQIRKLLTDEVHEFKVTGAEPSFIDMPAMHTHNITNTGATDLLTLFWAHEILDPNRPDTYSEIVKR